MSQREFFTLGIKLIGLYFLAVGIEEWFKRSSAALGYLSPLIQTDESFILSQWVSLLIPILLVTSALYLIRDGSHLRDFAFREDHEADLGHPTSLFATGVNLYGVFVIVSSVSGCLGIVVNLMIMLFAPSYWDTKILLDGIKSDLLPTLSAISLGFCCCAKASWFTRLSFRQV